MIITIDGPVATGKSTIAKKLADRLGFIFFDTGAIYRVIAYGMGKENLSTQHLDELSFFLSSFQPIIKIQKNERSYFYLEEDVTELIRTQDISSRASEIAKCKPVRDKVNEILRELVKNINAILEGRDMGTTVFPNAELKIFLTGRDEIRAKRRYEEFLERFPEQAKHSSLEQALQDLKRRDLADSTRELSPLRQPLDAIVIDTSELSIDDVLFKILEHKNLLR